MAAAGWIFWLVALQSLTSAVAHNHSRETDNYHVSAGHLFVLRCNTAATNVTWSRAGRHNQGLPTGVEVRDGLLWFLPVEMFHRGSYACERRDGAGVRMMFGVSVSSGKCPDPPEKRSIPKGVSGGVRCKQKEIFRLSNTSNIRWMKDCQPVLREGDPISVDKKGNMRLPAASERDAGTYTCLVDVTVDGRKYTTARSIQLTIKDDPTDEILPELEVVCPQQKVVTVEVGTRVELNCSAYVGFREDEDISMYWTVNSSYCEHFKEFNEFWKYVHERGRVYRRSTLTISTVQPQFLNVPFHCHVMSSADKKVCLVWLQEADHSTLHTIVALCLAGSLIILAVVGSSHLFKVDLVLAYRKLLRHTAKQDGKLYDAYVSCPHADTSSAEAASFALQTLPKELEKLHGYSLYIRGRDDCPGEAMHDTISSTVRQCRRLIIILSPNANCSACQRKEERLLCDYENQLCYEQKIGLYDALTQNDPKVILVEIDGPVDYSCLPESLRYIKRKQGSLKWNRPSLETQKFNKLRSNRNFWKKLRYYMPSVPAGRL